MYFRAGMDIWSLGEGPAATRFHRGLPQAIKELIACGPLAVSVGEERLERPTIAIHSLRHRGAQSVVPIREGNRLVVPQVVPETEHQRRRFEDAGRRREMRGGETHRKKEMRASLGAGWHV